MAVAASAEPLSGQEKKSSKLLSVCIFILVVEACERCCFYTLRPTQPTFYLSAHAPGEPAKSVAEVEALQQSFTMLCYFFPILGGYLADGYLGRFRTIVYFAAIYVVGTWLIAVSAIKPLMESSGGYWLFVIASLGFVGVGTGAIKPNVNSFGADQYDENDPDELQQREAFFQYFYWIINIGGFFSAVWFATMATQDVVSDDPGWGFFHSYLIAAGIMTTGYLVFVAGTPRYTKKEKVVHKPLFSVLYKYLMRGASSSTKGVLSVLGWILLFTSVVVSVVSSLLDNQRLFFDGFNGSAGLKVMSFVAIVMALVSMVCLIFAHSNNDWIQELSSPISGTDLSMGDVKDFFRTVPTNFLINVGFGLAYNSMDQYSRNACQMDVRLENKFLQTILLNKGQFNGGFYSLANNAAIILGIPALEFFYSSHRRRGGRPISRKTKYAVGFALVILANMVAIVIEVVRRGMSTGDDPSFVICPEDEFMKCNIDDPSACLCGPVRNVDASSMTDRSNWFLLSQCSGRETYEITLANQTVVSQQYLLPMTTMSACWIFIPMFITGCAEILVNPVVQEYVYDEGPMKLRSILQGLALIFNGTISGLIQSFLTFLVPNNFNSGHLILYYICASAGTLVSFLIYMCIANPDRRLERMTDQ